MPAFGAAVVLHLLVLAACGGESGYEPGEELSGGATTVFDEGVNAFSLAARNLEGARREKFFVGNSIFKRAWVTAPSSTTGLDGLGPTYNATSCAACHFKDGRGAPPADGEAFLGLLVRLSVPGTDEHGGPLGDPVYGGQFNHKSILGVPAEGTSRVSYVEVPGAFADGTAYSLRAPTYHLEDLAFGPLDPGIMMSPRTANHMVGLGLLEAIDEATILALADEDDADGDGISGRPNRVWDEQAQATRLGRFGWKANQPGIEQQVSGAFLGDMGITSPMFPVDSCPPAQTACAAAPNGGTPEVDQDKIDEVTHYSRLLAVPARRGADTATVLAGKELFLSAGCETCHTRKLVTAQLDGVPEVAHQTIYPFTDLLLHDMGEELADHRPDYLADGREWRTPPLWGIGLIRVVNRHTNFLHDGRARDLTEAILWHGGEGERSREAFRRMSAGDRAALVAFLESL
ncbi:MAG: c-type cytochrome [Deltaproteobacteria bacterium]|nr:c-type cytochrome [Deltaproteobacteria bacterium]